MPPPLLSYITGDPFRKYVTALKEDEKKRLKEKFKDATTAEIELLAKAFTPVSTAEFEIEEN